MNEVNNMFFELLRSVLTEKKLDKSLFEGLDEEGLEELYKLARKQDLAHIVLPALECSGISAEGKTANKLARHQLMAIYRYENQSFELGRICDTLEKNNVPFIPLKGAVIRELYPEPWMRTSCDVDVLVKNEDLGRAEAAILSELSYVRDTKTNAHDLSLYSESGDVHLELHFSLNEGIEGADDVLELAWENALPVSSEACRHRLTNEFAVFYLAAHTLYHFMAGGCGVRPLCDLYILKTRMGYDEAEVSKLCKSGGIYDFYVAMSKLSEVWFENRDHDDLTRRMEEFILTGGLFGVIESRVAVRQGVEGGRFKYALGRIFAPYDKLKSRYPKMKSRAQVPFYQVKRWVDTVKRGRGKTSINELKAAYEVSGESVDGIQRLMYDLKIQDKIK